MQQLQDRNKGLNHEEDLCSYARSDSEAVRELQESLHDADISGFMDLADIASGAAIPCSVREATRAATAIVVLVSPESVQSNWVQFEVGAALTMGKSIIPILICEAEIEDILPDWLEDLAYIDARKRPTGALVQEVARAIDSG